MFCGDAEVGKAPDEAASIERRAKGRSRKLERVGCCVAEDLLDRGGSGLKVGERGHPKGHHASAHGGGLQFDVGGTIEDHFFEGVVHGHDFVEGDPSFVAGVVAGFTAASLVNFKAEFFFFEAKVKEALFGDFDLFFAFEADLAAKALSDDQVGGGSDEEGFDAHVEEAVDGGGCVVGVEGGENQVSCESGFDGDLGGFKVADLTDHDDVGVLAEEGAEGGGKVEADVFVLLDLVDAVEVEFDGIFGGGDVGIGFIEFGESGIEGGGFSRTGRARDKDHAVGSVDGFLEVFELGVKEAEFGHIQLEVGFVEKTHNGLFAKEGGQDGDAKVHLTAFPEFELDPTVLWQAAFGDIQVAHDFEAGGDGVSVMEGWFHHFVEKAVDAVSDAHFFFIDFDVDVGGAAFDGIEQDHVDQADDGGFVGGAFEIESGFVVAVGVDDIDAVGVEFGHEGVVIVLG